MLSSTSLFHPEFFCTYNLKKLYNNHSHICYLTSSINILLIHLITYPSICLFFFMHLKFSFRNQCLSPLNTPACISLAKVQYLLIYSNFFSWNLYPVCVKSPSHVWLFMTPWTPASSVHGILQARILEWVAISFSIIPSVRSSKDCPFLLGCPFCWHIAIHSRLLWFSVFLCYQLELPFNFSFYWFCFFYWWV